MKKAIIAFLIIAAVGAFIFYNITNLNQNADESGIPRNALPVHWAYPEVQTIVSSVSARGTVSFRDKTLVYPSTQARILTVHVKVADEVKEGDLLITYDDEVLETLQDQLAQARLTLASAELGLAATRIGATDTEILAAENNIEQARVGIKNIESQLEQMDLQIAQAQDNITTAENTLSNTQFLFENGVIPRKELDDATEAVRVLQDRLSILQSQRDAAALGLPNALEQERFAIAQRDALLDKSNQPAAVNQMRVQQVAIEQAQLNIERIERDIENFKREEFAPVSGTILNVAVEEGDVSVNGRVLFEIADISHENLIIKVNVPENESRGILEGLEVKISGRAIGRDVYKGYIELIHPVAVQRSIGNSPSPETVIEVEIALAEETPLRAGNTVDAEIITRTSEDTLVVPMMSTLSASGGENYVFVVTDDSTLERVDIELGEFSTMYIEAIGITENCRVVNNPTTAMQEGMIVRPVQPIT